MQYFEKTVVKKWRKFAWVSKELSEFCGYSHLFSRLWYRTSPEVEAPVAKKESAEDWWAQRIDECVAESQEILDQIAFENMPTEVVAPMIILPEAYVLKGEGTRIERPQSPL